MAKTLEQCDKLFIANDAPAALPTIGKRIMPTNSLLIELSAVNPLMDETRNSAVIATVWETIECFAGAVRE